MYSVRITLHTEYRHQSHGLWESARRVGHLHGSFAFLNANELLLPLLEEFHAATGEHFRPSPGGTLHFIPQSAWGRLIACVRADVRARAT